MQSKWIPLLSTSLDSAARKWAMYVPAGSWCELVSNIEPSREGSDTYEVVAGLTNLNKKIYVQTTFVVPSKAPKHPMSKYIVRWDACIEVYVVTLRETVSRWAYTPCYAQSDADQPENKTIDAGSPANTNALSPDSAELNNTAADGTMEHSNSDALRALPEGAAQAAGNVPVVPTACDATVVTNSFEDVVTSDSPVSTSEGASSASSHDTLSSAAGTVLSENLNDAHENGQGNEVEDCCLSPRVKGPESPGSNNPEAPGSQEIRNEMDDNMSNSPIKPYDLPRPGVPTPARALGMVYETDDSLFESPIKACNIVRPGAPTPGRGRSRYLHDSIASDDDESFVVPTKLEFEDVFGIDESSLTCDVPTNDIDSNALLPPLDRTSLNLSYMAKVLDLDLRHNTTMIHTQLDWLTIELTPSKAELFADYKLLSRNKVQEYLAEAIKDIEKLAFQHKTTSDVITPEPCPSVHSEGDAMDIDLDEIFGGQGITDLGDDEGVVHGVPSKPVLAFAAPEVGESEDMLEAISYASDLLSCKTTGLPLSRFVPRGDEAIDAIRVTFKDKSFDYDRIGARLAASEVAYAHSYRGLEDLKRNGLAFRRYLVEAKPEMSKTDNTLEVAMSPATKNIVGHYNVLGDKIHTPSATPVSVSLFVQVAATHKPRFFPWSRKGVMLAQATKFVDVVVYHGPLDAEALQSLRGSKLQDHIIGYVVKVNDLQGNFGNPFDEETIFEEFEDICDNRLIKDDEETNLQRIYIVNDVHHDTLPPRIMCGRVAKRTVFFTKVNGTGLITHWTSKDVTHLTNNETSDKSQSYSNLWAIKSVEEVFGSAHDTKELVENREIFEIIEEEEEISVAPIQNEIPDVHRSAADKSIPLMIEAPPVAEASAVVVPREDGGDSGYISEDNDVAEAKVQPKAVESDDEEYSPHDPIIPGLQAAHEDWQPEGMADAEALRCLDEILKRVPADGHAHDADEEPVTEEDLPDDYMQFYKPPREEFEGYGVDVQQQQSGESSSEQDTDEEKQQSSPATTPPSSPVQSTSLSLSPHSIITDCPPSFPDKTSDIASTAKPRKAPRQEEGLSKYALPYAAVMFTIGIVLSFC
ncbi:MAG: hypothetical protein Q9170_005420 [Blastenia crenularia]